VYVLESAWAAPVVVAVVVPHSGQYSGKGEEEEGLATQKCWVLGHVVHIDDEIYRNASKDMRKHIYIYIYNTQQCTM
jgi:hypothetical protein